MTEQRPDGYGTAGYGEVLRVVNRLFRDEIWRMDGSDGWQRALTALVDALKALRIPLDSCDIHRVDAESESPAILCLFSWQDNRWRQSVVGEDRDTISHLWRSGEPSYRSDLMLVDLHAQGEVLSVRHSYGVRSTLDVPFANGVLSLHSRGPDAFSVRDIELVRELAENLVTLFYRLDDLKELEATQRQVEQAQRLEMVGQLAAGMAHEINNCLSVILGQSELLLLDELDPAVRESVELISRAAEGTKSSSRRLLDMARGQEPERQLVDLNKLVMETVELVRRQFKRDQIEIADELSSGLPLVHGEPAQLQQIVINLLQNGRDALNGTRKAGLIKIRTSELGNRVALTIQDDGPGIPERVRRRVFEPFFTTKEMGKGTGLGLSVCQTIAHNHGGCIELASTERGTSVVLDLPAADRAAMLAFN